jgi:DNA polymerase-1
MDIYTFLAEACSMSRRDAKDATLGRMYGMGYKTFAIKQNITQDAAKKKLEDFDKSAPFVKEISDLTTQLAADHGYIKTLLGRRRHFNLWEPVRYSYEKEEYVTPLSREAAEKKWPGEKLRRFGIRKALNSLIQGSAADMLKQALVTTYENHKILPYMVVHDELDYGVTDKDHAVILQKSAETCLKIEVPIRADLKFGDSWC